MPGNRKASKRVTKALQAKAAQYISPEELALMKEKLRKPTARASISDSHHGDENVDMPARTAGVLSGDNMHNVSLKQEVLGAQPAVNVAVAAPEPEPMVEVAPLPALAVVLDAPKVQELVYSPHADVDSPVNEGVILEAFLEAQLAATVEAAFASPAKAPVEEVVEVETSSCSHLSHKVIDFFGAAARWVAPAVAVGIVVVIRLRR